MATHPPSATIHCADLCFSYGGPDILRGLSLDLPAGSRCLLLGANGAGKSTLLRILAGKRLVHDDVLVKGQHAYFNTPAGITHLAPEWVQHSATHGDVAVETLLASHAADAHPARCAALLELLEVDATWHTHTLSDGQRRRVQLLLGLLCPFDVLLLDEVTVDLDVLVRKDLLGFLRSECEQRQSTVLYCSHILDGLADWPTHVARIRHGQIISLTPFDQLINSFAGERQLHPSLDSPLMQIAHMWLREDREYRKQLHLGNGEQRAQTKYDLLKDDMRLHGDKYYNYWLRGEPY